MADPRYVRAAPVLDGPEQFDAAFFGYSPREAALIEPQQRIFLEVAWESFEDAGYDPRGYKGDVGVFAGGGGAITSYLLAHSADSRIRGQTGSLEAIANDRDYLSTRVSFKLDLTGPSITVQTACSTSLVATHLACQSLHSGECHAALAGASSVRVPHEQGYLAEKGGIYSLDGHCRSFDAGGTGTIFGSGVVAVLLKRVEDALVDGDHIYAVIKGTAVNNDGFRKVSYTAPSMQGQARAMVEAMAAADVTADSIGYVECHATGTRVGDPIEVEALTRAFQMQTERRGFCALGSVKANIGHPEQAAGLAGLIKTALVLDRGTIPPNIHLEDPNPGIDFENSPFFVHHQGMPFPQVAAKRRAGVNSLGIGGTNAFAVLEQAPAPPPRRADKGSLQLLCLSARSGEALRAGAENLAETLGTSSEEDLGDLCFTTRVSRSRFPYRLAFSAGDLETTRGRLLHFAAGGWEADQSARAKPGRIAFLFSGQGEQFPGMASQLYRTQPTFRAALDTCDSLASPELGRGLLDVILGSDEASKALLDETLFTQPALFAVEYALARMWRAWGIEPDVVLGHSLGEITAACVAEVFDLATAMRLVVGRATLMQSLPRNGSMAAVFAAGPEVEAFLEIQEAHGVEIAALNSPQNTVLSGPKAAIDALMKSLASGGIAAKQLRVSHGFHSGLVEPILEDLEALATTLEARAPKIPLISNLSGRAMDGAPPPSYWCDHARRCVRFEEGISSLADLGCTVFLEVGPGTGLSAMARQGWTGPEASWLRSVDRRRNKDWETVSETLKQLYLKGFAVDWPAVDEGQGRRRLPLPTYPFEHRPYWLDSAIEPGRGTQIPKGEPERPAQDTSAIRREIEPWLHRLEWRHRERPSNSSTSGQATGPWLVLAGEGALGMELAQVLSTRGHRCHLVLRSNDPIDDGDGWRLADSPSPDQLVNLLGELAELEGGKPFNGIVHAWSTDLAANDSMTLRDLADAEARTVRSALFLIQAVLGSTAWRGARLWFVTRQAVATGTEAVQVSLAQAPLHGLARTVAVEHPSLWGGLIDLPAGGASRSDADHLADELESPRGEQVALRPGGRFTARLTPSQTGSESAQPVRFQAHACYLITGGLGMIGLRTARWLVVERGVRSLVLTGRSKPNPTALKVIRDLERFGAAVATLTADVCSEADMRGVMARIDAEHPPLKGVIHCSGVLLDRILERQDWESFSSVTAPKVLGGWLLHSLTKNRDLDFFILHSSLVSLTGSAAQGNYAAANAFLDALIDHRRHLGLPATAINWGPWREHGLATVSGASGDQYWRRLGVRWLPTEIGMKALALSHDRGVDHLVVVDADWDQYATARPATATLLEELLQPKTERTGAPQTSSPTSRGDWRTLLSGQPQERHRGILSSTLEDQVRAELGIDEPIDPDRPLDELGLDSLMSVGLANRLETTVGLAISTASLIGGPSLHQLAEQILTDLRNEDVPAKPPTAPTRQKRAAGSRSRVSPGRWLVIPRPNPEARIRLFCFPYAGGGAQVYRPWAELLAPEIELVAVEAPGHGSRIDEPATTRIETYLRGLLPDLRPYLDRPSAFFGHCLGGLTAWATTNELSRIQAPLPGHLFIAGARPPHQSHSIGPFEETLLGDLLRTPGFDPWTELFHQGDEVFTQMLHNFDNEAIEEWLSSSELGGLLLPIVRADFEMASHFVPTTEPRWDIPITFFAGVRDTYVSRRDSLAWSNYTQTCFNVHFLEATHFMITESRDHILSTIRQELSAAATPRPRHHPPPQHTRVAREGLGPAILGLEDPPLPDLDDGQPSASASAFARLEETSVRQCLSIWNRMGVLKSPEERWILEDLLGHLAISEPYRKLSFAQLQILCSAGFVNLDGDRVSGTRRLAEPVLDNLETDWRRLALSCEEIKAHVTLVTRCAASQAEVVRGHRPPTDVLFPNGSMDLVSSIYRDHFSADWYNQLTARVVAARLNVRLAHSDGPIRVLEVGAGTGATTVSVLRELVPHYARLEYCFSDVSTAFTGHGQSSFGEHPFMSFSHLDLEIPPVDQGFEPGSYDIILGSNVLHATRIVRRTLGHLSYLLDPVGCLVINELTFNQSWLTQTFGLLPGWWLAEDTADRLPASPLLAPEQWRRALESTGFEDIRTQALPAPPGRNPSQHVIVATKASTPNGVQPR